jgi:flagellar biosynthesis chaperone FliJ
MFDEDKVQKNLEKMRKAYEKAIKKIADLEKEQDEIGREIDAIISKQKE